MYITLSFANEKFIKALVSLSLPKPLFQSKAKGEATDMKIMFILMQIELIFSQERFCT